MWAQRHDKLYITLEVFGVKEEKITLSKDKLTFSGIRTDDNAKMAVELDFYAEVDPENSQQSISPRNVSFILKKADDTQPYWPRLVKTAQKLHYIHIDFSKWVDEDDESEDPKADNFDFPGMSSFDPSQFAGFGGSGDMDEEDYAEVSSGEDEAEDGKEEEENEDKK